MNTWDILLTLLLTAITLAALRSCLHRQSQGGCNCGCDGCQRQCGKYKT